MDAFEAATRHLEPASPEVEQFLRLPSAWLRDGRHDIEEDALDAKTKALREAFDELFSNPDTRVLFSMGGYLHGTPISDRLSEWVIDVDAGRLPCPRWNKRRLRWAPRDAHIVRAIERLCELGLTATRGDGRPPRSACDAVAKVIHLTYPEVKRIWVNRNPKTSSRRSRSR